MRGPGQCYNQYVSDDDANASNEGVQDRAADRPADPANTLSFTIDLDECLGSVAWNVGFLTVRITATTPVGDNASQWLHFVRR